jgi:hypothetical protein
VDTPHPNVAPIEQLVSHTEEIVIHRPLEVVLDAETKTSLEKAIARNSGMPGVSGTHMLTKGDYGPSGSRRLTCLTDGSTLVEEVLENVRDESRRNSVTSYGTTPAKKPAPSCMGSGISFEQTWAEAAPTYAGLIRFSSIATGFRVIWGGWVTSCSASDFSTGNTQR